jgi:hypothetical protein
VVWGGRDGSYRALSSGAWYDPRTQRWHTMRAAPFGSVTSSDSDFDFGFGVAHEAVIVAGTKAAGYAPATDTWRLLPPIPLQTIDGPAIAQPGAPAWVMLSGQDRAGHGAIAWLDPTRGTEWHTAELHARAPVVLLANGHIAYWYADQRRRGVDLDLATGAERAIQAMPAALFHGYPFAPGTVAGSLVISPLAQVSWNATTDAFARLPNRAVGSTGVAASGYCGSATAWTGSVLLTWGGSECQGNSYLDTGAAYDPSTGSLQPLPKFLSGRTEMAYAWTGSQLLVWGGETGVNDRVTATGAALTVNAP